MVTKQHFITIKNFFWEAARGKGKGMGAASPFLSYRSGAAHGVS